VAESEDVALFFLQRTESKRLGVLVIFDIQGSQGARLSDSDQDVSTPPRFG
jgi:hypothetical protein